MVFYEKSINASLASVSRWERGEHEPTPIAKVKLEDLFKEADLWDYESMFNLKNIFKKVKNA